MSELWEGLCFINAAKQVIPPEAAEELAQKTIGTSRFDWVETRLKIRELETRLRMAIMDQLGNWSMRTETEITAIGQIIDDDRASLLGLLEQWEDTYWEYLSDEFITMMSADQNKLWESATLEQFRQTGKYNRISLGDDGTLHITIIKPGIMDNKTVNVGTQFVEPIREYVKQNPLNWDRTGEGFKHWYTGLGGVYEFVRIIPLLRQGPDGHNIDLRWIGEHTNPVTKLEWGNYHVDDIATIMVYPANYTEPK